MIAGELFDRSQPYLKPKVSSILINSLTAKIEYYPSINLVTTPAGKLQQIVGYDLTKLYPVTQLAMASELIKKSKTIAVPTEIEIGSGTVHNPSPANTLSLKVDLNPPFTESQTKIDPIYEGGVTIWLNGDFNQMATSLPKVDRIYMIAPFPNDETDRPEINFTSLVQSALNTLGRGGQLVIIPVPDHYEAIKKGLSTIEGVKYFKLNQVQKMPEFKSLPWIKNPKSDYLGNVKPEEVPVVIITK